jgi:hypothetical protein
MQFGLLRRCSGTNILRSVVCNIIHSLLLDGQKHCKATRYNATIAGFYLFDGHTVLQGKTLRIGCVSNLSSLVPDGPEVTLTSVCANMQFPLPEGQERWQVQDSHKMLTWTQLFFF